MVTPTTSAAFEQALRDRISAYFNTQQLSKKAHTTAWVKTWLMLITWVATISCIYLVDTSFKGYILLYLLHGLSALLVIFNISHDAVHQTLSPKRWVNILWGYTFNLVGGNSYTWHLKHNLGHHGATNIHGRDPDIETTPLFRVSPHSPHRWYYRFQHLYVLPLYCLMSLLLIFVIDMRAMALMDARQPFSIKLQRWTVLLAGKLFYIGYLLILPIFVLPLRAAEVFTCFLLMHALLGLIISLVLLPSHFIEPVRYYETPRGSVLPSSWSLHQLLTTADMAAGSRLANALLGGLNANVIHHIFPAIHHCHFIPLVKILQTTAREYGLPYHTYTMWDGLQRHFAYLKKMGRAQSIP